MDAHQLNKAMQHAALQLQVAPSAQEGPRGQSLPTGKRVFHAGPIVSKQNVRDMQSQRGAMQFLSPRGSEGPQTTTVGPILLERTAKQNGTRCPNRHVQQLGTASPGSCVRAPVVELASSVAEAKHTETPAKALLLLHHCIIELL